MLASVAMARRGWQLVAVFVLALAVVERGGRTAYFATNIDMHGDADVSKRQALTRALDQRLESAGESVRAADEVVQGAQQQLADAARDRRVLDRLKDRHAEQWRVDAAHKDRLGMDEVALARFSRTADVRAADDAATRAPREQGAQDSPRTNGSTQ